MAGWRGRRYVGNERAELLSAECWQVKILLGFSPSINKASKKSNIWTTRRLHNSCLCFPSSATGLFQIKLRHIPYSSALTKCPFFSEESKGGWRRKLTPDHLHWCFSATWRISKVEMETNKNQMAQLTGKISQIKFCSRKVIAPIFLAPQKPRN